VVRVLSEEDSKAMPEYCDFCWKPKGEDGRYLIHNGHHTECICNLCIRNLYEQINRLEALINAPTGAAN